MGGNCLSPFSLVFSRFPMSCFLVFCVFFLQKRGRSSSSRSIIVFFFSSKNQQIYTYIDLIERERGRESDSYIYIYIQSEERKNKREKFNEIGFLGVLHVRLLCVCVCVACLVRRDGTRKQLNLPPPILVVLRTYISCPYLKGLKGDTCCRTGSGCSPYAHFVTSRTGPDSGYR